MSMYLPAHFEEKRLDVLHDFVRAHPFGLCVTHGAQGLLANSVPFLIEPGGAAGLGVLRAHVARANPVWRDPGPGEALVVFQGAQGYVSPGWYPSKAEHGKVVPTWNYMIAQARGRFRAIEDRDWLRALVRRLTDHHEASRSQPWRIDDAPESYLAAMLEGIVGVEIEITELEGKWKLSQNRSAADRAGVIDGLRSVGVSAADTPLGETDPKGSHGSADDPARAAEAVALARAMADAAPRR